MAKEVFDNKPLPERGGNWHTPILAYEIYLVTPVADRLIFEMKPTSPKIIDFSAAGSLRSTPEPPKTERLNIYIDEDCRIELNLSATLKWRWNEEMAVGRGKDTVPHYFNLRYWDEVNQKWVMPTKNADYKAIQFCAERRPHGREKDAINFNVLLEYSGTEMLPVSIDPDIQNPRT